MTVYDLYADVEQLTVNADTGVPIQFLGGASLSSGATIDYAVSRVTLAKLTSGSGTSTGSTD